MTKRKLRRKVKTLRRQRSSLAERLRLCQQAGRRQREIIERLQNRLALIDDILEGRNDQ